MTQRLCDAGMGVAASSQMAAEPGGDRLSRAAAAWLRAAHETGRGRARRASGPVIHLDGVKAPPALILPDPATRFARTAARLEALAAGHPMAEWLAFMARLTRAQHVVATTLRPFPGPQQITVESAVEARLPPLAAEGHRRDAAWREGLTMLLDTFDGRASPLPARAAVANLRARDADAVEALADRFLIRGVDDADAGAALYVAAALQVYFTRAVAGLPAASLRLLPQRGLCPCCGSTPVSGVVTASGRNSGARYLYCSLCATAWNHVRAVCITCGRGARTVAGGDRGRRRPCQSRDL